MISRAFVLYATESYANTAQGCVNSLNIVSDLPVYVYMMNSDVQIEGAHTIRWNCDITNPKQQSYINRADPDIYDILIQRPLIVADALKHIKVVAYVDSDSVATKYVDRIFDYYPTECTYPYFTDGIYDYLSVNGHTNLEIPACELFDVSYKLRTKYKQTGYFVAGQNTIDFLEEWYNMCTDAVVMANPFYYAPFHEETIVNVLLWKKGITEGLPLVYINGTPTDIQQYGYTGTLVREWLRIPSDERELLFYHGEKNLEKMNQMTQKKKLKIMYLAPHLSTGGMPAFLLKRIECLKDVVDISVIEYQNYSMDYVVQRNAIMKLADHFGTIGEDKMGVFHFINQLNPDIIHIDEMSERLHPAMVEQLYNPNRKYKIVETCHDVSFNPADKRFIPDMFLFCTPYHLDTFKDIPTYASVIEFPIDVHYKDRVSSIRFDKSKVHVLNVGLWTPGKNQAEGLAIAKLYPEMQFHFVGNQAVNFQDYWEPLMKDVPENVTIWGERNDVDVFMKNADIFMFNSTWECNPLVLREAIGYGMPIIAHNLPQYKGMFDKYIQPIDTDLRNIGADYDIPLNNTSKIFGKKHLDIYTKLMNIQDEPVPVQAPKIKISQHFVNNPFLEITGESDSDFLVKFFDENNVCHYENTIKSNHWVKLNRSYYTKWTAKVWQDGKFIYENTLDYTGKRVLISFDSESLGDTIAWMPYVLEFQNKHNCKVIVGTFKNSLFEKMYPELEFVKPGTTVQNLYGMYKIGWFYNPDMEPVIPNTIPLQQTITNILGLDYTEIRPRIDYTSKPRAAKFKYVAIATNSTAGCKFWVKDEWQKLVNKLISKGYKVINVSKEKNNLEGVTQIKDTSLENTMHIINYSEFFIGLSSGLSWLAWAMGKHVVMISNFTEANHEFQGDCTRIIKKDVCHGCWNNPNFKFDKGDYNWCPIHKNTPRQFECHKSITADSVLQAIPNFRY